MVRSTLIPGLMLAIALAPPVRAQGRGADTTTVLALMQRFHDALKRGDSSTILNLLAPDAIVLETGGVESRAAYREGHLPADLRFAKAVTSAHHPVRVTISGNVAWVVISSETTGSFNDQPVNNMGAELTVLTRAGSGWLIRAIHWSSRRRSL